MTHRLKKVKAKMCRLFIKTLKKFVIILNRDANEIFSLKQSKNKITITW